ncbi:hypothetical protein TWF970_000704 [Orbilia oligospora]|uniref:CBM21 domain-containing protein n=1 Tax=Orbilia oligospora TaxID=2813651 RepID=A0A7C8VKQ8_ORBOL|nr:hypothetical protein TWF970_000704 [Orbilia oligospora]
MAEMAKAPVTSDEADQQIYDLAQDCERLFGELLSALSVTSDKQYRVVLEHQQRFESWASFLGVFAAYQTSLDSRLKTTPDIRDLVVQLLEVLKRNVLYGLNSEALRPSRQAEATQAFLNGISGSISRLHRLGIAIRKASPVRELARKTGDDYAFFERVVVLLLRGLYPDISDPFLNQLAQSVSFRTQRLLYQQKHQKKPKTQRRAHPAESSPPNLRPARNDETKSEVAPFVALPAQQEFSDIRSSDLHTTEVSAATHPSTLVPENFGLHTTKTEDEEVISGPPTVSSISDANPYPPPPKVSPGANHTNCDWCSQELQVPDGETGWRYKWRSHFKKDLEPYVCISEECANELVYFLSLRAWRKHMDSFHTVNWARDIHKPSIWYCDLEHEYQEFLDAKALRVHLFQDHEDKVTPDRVDTIVRRQVLLISRGSNTCPLCALDISAVDPDSSQANSSATHPDSPGRTSQRGQAKKVAIRTAECGSSSDEEHLADADVPAPEADDSVIPEENLDRVNSTKLATHVAGHLKSLAFISLRYFGDNSDSIQSERGGIGEECSNQERPGDHYFELDSSLSFEDVVPDERVLFDEIMWRDKNFKPSIKGTDPGFYRNASSRDDKKVHFEAGLGRFRYFRQAERASALSSSAPLARELDDDYDVNSFRSSFRIVPVNFSNGTTNVNNINKVQFSGVELSEDMETLVGTVAAADGVFPTYVVVRFTFDSWYKVSEVPASPPLDLNKGSEHGYYEYKFKIKLNDIPNLRGRALLFCLRYGLENREYWDNNSSLNYKVCFESFSVVTTEHPSLLRGRPRPSSVPIIDDSLNPGETPPTYFSPGLDNLFRRRFGGAT